MTAAAEADIISVVDWLCESSTAAANRFIDDIERAFAQLAQFPLSGRRRLPMAENRRAIVRGDYVVTYEFTGHTVVIRRVLRGAQERTPF
ncbi:MAG TPA: type II toxin-antitoxin system RelE/ParE family toxin [Tepidiformaceae bacterium]|nr:type II toxin-antitoxin system RelE/ParE family toxin [Tepidiformaceae bacterium]